MFSQILPLALACVTLALHDLREVVHGVKSVPAVKYDLAASNSSSPCQLLSAVYDASNSTDDGAVVVAIPPSVGLSCLKSVPVDKDRDIALLDYITPYVSFQSTIEILADPPEGYLLPGVDLLGGLSKIRTNLEEENYDSQFAVMLDLQSLASIYCQESGYGS